METKSSGESYDRVRQVEESEDMGEKGVPKQIEVQLK